MNIFSITWIIRVLNDLIWLFFMKKKSQMLSESSDSYVVFNRRLLTQVNFSLVVIHDLEADLIWAWVWKIEMKEIDQYKKMNWLADKNLLSAKMLHACIMIFNYKSKWHKDASKQRRDLCVNQLLTSLDNKWKKIRC